MVLFHDLYMNKQVLTGFICFCSIGGINIAMLFAFAWSH